jgi:hypothetical protein
MDEIYIVHLIFSIGSRKLVMCTATYHGARYATDLTMSAHSLIHTSLDRPAATDETAFRLPQTNRAISTFWHIGDRVSALVRRVASTLNRWQAEQAFSDLLARDPRMRADLLAARLNAERLQDPGLSNPRSATKLVYCNAATTIGRIDSKTSRASYPGRSPSPSNAQADD